VEAQFLCCKYGFIEYLFATEKRMNKLFVEGSRTLGIWKEKPILLFCLPSPYTTRPSIVNNKKLLILFSEQVIDKIITTTKELKFN
jgi:hypothetical protein